jgi:hypothetical protein
MADEPAIVAPEPSSGASRTAGHGVAPGSGVGAPIRARTLAGTCSVFQFGNGISSARSHQRLEVRLRILAPHLHGCSVVCGSGL